MSFFTVKTKNTQKTELMVYNQGFSKIKKYIARLCKAGKEIPVGISHE